LHGTEGEDGSLQAFLEKNQVKFTGSDSKSSQQAFDKRATKKVAESLGIKVVNDFALKSFHHNEITELEQFFGTHGKIVLKPLANGSSVGLYIISHRAELDDAIQSIKSSKIIVPYMVEPFIAGREITVGVWQKTPTELM